MDHHAFTEGSRLLVWHLQNSWGPFLELFLKSQEVRKSPKDRKLLVKACIVQKPWGFIQTFLKSDAWQLWLQIRQIFWKKSCCCCGLYIRGTRRYDLRGGYQTRQGDSLRHSEEKTSTSSSRGSGEPLPVCGSTTAAAPPPSKQRMRRPWHYHFFSHLSSIVKAFTTSTAAV